MAISELRNIYLEKKLSRWTHQQIDLEEKLVTRKWNNRNYPVCTMGRKRIGKKTNSLKNCESITKYLTVVSLQFWKKQRRAG